MFETATVIENGFEQVILRDVTSGTFVAIIPSCGAILHSFTVAHSGALINVIDHYDDAADFKVNVTNKGFKGAKLSPFACRIRNAQYHFGEIDYSIEKFLLGKHAIHGLVYDAVFSVVSLQAEETFAMVSLIHSYQALDNGYPFYYDCVVNYRLSADNNLSVSTIVINKDKGLIPVQDGWHPYFTFGGPIDELQLEFQSKVTLEFNEEMIPTGECWPYQEFGSLKLIGNASFDHCFTVNFAECQPLCVLRDPVKKIQLEIYPGNDYPYLQVYAPGHRRSIALENLSAAPDAFNNKMGLIVLQPEESRTFTTTYKITSLI